MDMGPSLRGLNEDGLKVFSVGVVMLFWLEGVWLSQVDLIEENSRSFTFNPQVQSFKIHQSRLCVKGLRPKAFNTFDILHFGCCISSPFSHANVSSGRCNPRDISTQEIEAPESNCSIYALHQMQRLRAIVGPPTCDLKQPGMLHVTGTPNEWNVREDSILIPSDISLGKRANESLELLNHRS